MKDIIDIEGAKEDIKVLEEEFLKLSHEWEAYDGEPSPCSLIAKTELILALNIARKYKGFIFEYNESEYKGYDEWYKDQTLSRTDLYKYNITEDNYGLADAVACDIQNELITYLKSEIGE